MDVFENMLYRDLIDMPPVVETARPSLLGGVNRWFDSVDGGEHQRDLEYDPLLDYPRDL